MRWLPFASLILALLLLPDWSGYALQLANAQGFAKGAGAIGKQGDQGAGKAANEHPTAAEQGRAALAFLETLSKEDAYYVRLLDWRAEKLKDLPTFKLLVQWWLNQMSMAQAVAYLHDVPGNPHLSWIDIREYKWVFGGWQAVAEREPYDQEPHIPSPVSIKLREVTGHGPLRKAITDKDAYPVLAMVSGRWLFRETIETLRSEAYYDLLFGKERFGKSVPVGGKGGPGGAGRGGRAEQGGRSERVLVERAGQLWNIPRVDVKDGDRIKSQVVTREGQTVYIDEPGSGGSGGSGDGEKAQDNTEKKAAFPKDIDDWDAFFGLDVVRTFGAKKEIDLDYGAVVRGGADFPKSGSIVSLRNRLLLQEPSAYSIAMRTFDVFVTAGEFDYSELAPKIPLLVRKKKVKFKAGELLAYLPNGGQAALLIDEKTNRIELAVGQAAQNTLEKRMNPGVRIPGDCVTCHAPDGGYILPRNVIKEYNEKGLDAKFKNFADRERHRGFFLEWEEKVEPYQKSFNALLARATKTPENPKGWDGAKLVTEFRKARDVYDDPVTTAIAAGEMGIPVELFRRIMVKSTLNALGSLQRGIDIPRSVWEVDAYKVAERLRLVSE